MSKRITIKSIAKDLGISHMTVSRALSGNANVQEETRIAVVKRAKELGYVKSAAANAMRGEQTKIVGLLLPNLVNEFYATFSDSLAKSCEEQGLQLIIHLTSDDIEKEQMAIQRLREVQAESVVMVPAPGEYEHAENYLEGLDVIQLIRQRITATPCASVLVEDVAAISHAVEHLASDGKHKRIAYIGGDIVLSSGKTRLTAFLGGMKRAGLEPVEEDLFVATPSFSMAYNAARSIIDSGYATAIVCGGVEISNGALNACLEQGVRFPTDLAFVGYGDPSYYRWTGGGISTITIPVHELAVKTAWLLKQRRSTESDASQLLQVLPAELLVRRSSIQR